MALPTQVIHIHPYAPAKPAEGSPCNGCGVCCLAEPCPLGVVLSGRRQGACTALRWDDGLTLYRCGAITEAPQVLATALPWGLRWIAPSMAKLLRPLAVRWIAAGVGCDSSLQAEPGPQ